MNQKQQSSDSLQTELRNLRKQNAHLKDLNTLIFQQISTISGFSDWLTFVQWLISCFPSRAPLKLSPGPLSQIKQQSEYSLSEANPFSPLNTGQFSNENWKQGTHQLMLGQTIKSKDLNSVDKNITLDALALENSYLRQEIAQLKEKLANSQENIKSLLFVLKYDLNNDTTSEKAIDETSRRSKIQRSNYTYTQKSALLDRSEQLQQVKYKKSRCSYLTVIDDFKKSLNHLTSQQY